MSNATDETVVQPAVRTDTKVQPAVTDDQPPPAQPSTEPDFSWPDLFGVALCAAVFGVLLTLSLDLIAAAEPGRHRGGITLALMVGGLTVGMAWALHYFASAVVSQVRCALRRRSR